MTAEATSHSEATAHSSARPSSAERALDSNLIQYRKHFEFGPVRAAARVLLSARRIGVAATLETARDVYWERLATCLTRPRLVLHNRICIALSPSRNKVALHELRKTREQILSRGTKGYRVAPDDFLAESAKQDVLTNASEVVIGEIDQDGYVLSQVGALQGIPTVTADRFLPRNRFRLTLIVRDGTLAVRKDYRGNLQSFLTEIHILDAMAQAGCNVPALLDIDIDRLHIVMSYIAGHVVREALANHSAVLRDRDVKDHFNGLAPRELRLARIQEGRRVLAKVMDEEFIEHLFRQLRLMHLHRFIWGDIKYGNIVIERKSGRPYLLDFEGASYHPELGERTFRRLADRDIEKFNLHFGTDKLTTKRLRDRAVTIPERNVYAPAYFTAGISIGNLWSNSDGYGRWRFLLKQALPPAKDARILDLGANNGFNALQLLRSGAREVVGIELDERFFEQGKFLRTAFEYTDCTNYRFRYLRGNMKDLGSMNLGRFDFAMALCCIYYLDDDDIAAVARYLSTITDTFVLQCNTAVGIGRSDAHTYVKASVDYARKILSGAGFCEIKVIAPPKYHRPLVIGRFPGAPADFRRLSHPQTGRQGSNTRGRSE